MSSSSLGHVDYNINGSSEKRKDASPSATTASDIDHVRPGSSEEFEVEVVGVEKTDVASTKSRRPALSRVSSRLTTHSLRDPGPPPDGGLKAWTQVAAGWLAILVTWGWVNCFGVFQTYYTIHLPQTPSEISWIGTTQSFFTFCIGAFSGRLLDAGYFYPTIIAGSVLQLLGMFLMSISTKYWQLILTQGVLTGVGGGIIFTPCMGIMATYFSKRRALALGIASTGNSAGGLVYPVVVRELIPQLGFAWTTRILGFINLAALCIVIAFIRPRLPPHKSGPMVDWSAFTELPYVLYCIAVFNLTWNVNFTLYYVSSFGDEIVHMAFKSSAVLLIIVNGIGVPARILPAFLGDKLGQLNTITPLAIGLALVSWCWLGVTSATGLYVWTCFYGIMAAAVQCLVPATAVSLTKNMNVIGSRLGIMFSFMGLGAFTGPPIGGAIISARPTKASYVAAQCWAAAAITLCAGILVVTRMTRARGKIKIKV